MKNYSVSISNIPAFLEKHFGKNAIAEFETESKRAFFGDTAKTEDERSAMEALWECYKAARIHTAQWDKEIPTITLLRVGGRPIILTNPSVLGAILDYYAHRPFTFYQTAWTDTPTGKAGVITRIKERRTWVWDGEEPKFNIVIANFKKADTKAAQFIADTLSDNVQTVWKFNFRPSSEYVSVSETPISYQFWYGKYYPTEYPVIAGFGEIRDKIRNPKWENAGVFDFYSDYPEYQYKYVGDPN